NYSYIEEYLKTTKSFSKIITSMPNFSVENIDKFINKFEHENLKLLYPSLKDYNEEDLNYTLLILENMLNNLIVIDDEELSLNEQVDNILKSFKISNPLLFKKSFIATRLGQKDLSIDNAIDDINSRLELDNLKLELPKTKEQQEKEVLELVQVR
ncbi:MAG: hypothetical protein U9Q66_03240, partial [Patescibacteria group bacterium]|nr:hypothetical protein [Patescibacteria group bacterium]